MLLFSLEIFGKHLGHAYTDFVPDDVEEVCRTKNGVIIKRPDSRGVHPVYRYSYDGLPDSFLEGYIKKDKQTFHLFRVYNGSPTRLPLAKLTDLFQGLEGDLKSHGIQTISTNAIRRLVPVAISRYGFEYANSVERIRDAVLPRKKLGILTVGLVKNIS